MSPTDGGEGVTLCHQAEGVGWKDCMVCLVGVTNVFSCGTIRNKGKSYVMWIYLGAQDEMGC